MIFSHFVGFLQSVDSVSFDAQKYCVNEAQFFHFPFVALFLSFRSKKLQLSLVSRSFSPVFDSRTFEA